MRNLEFDPAALDDLAWRQWSVVYRQWSVVYCQLSVAEGAGRVEVEVASSQRKRGALRNMNNKTADAKAVVAMWDRVIHLEESISATAARALLKLRFPPQDVARMQTLAAKARRGDLTETEAVEMDAFEQMGCLLDILHAKVRRVLDARRRMA